MPAKPPIKKKPVAPEPLLQTPEEQISKTELWKIEADYALGSLVEELRDFDTEGVTDYAELTAKSHGIYREWNRSKKGRDKDWIFMVRMGIPGGGPFTLDQWRILDEASNKYTNANPYGGPTLRLTTRQDIQFHWVKKRDLVPLVQEIVKTGYYTRNGCGDNTRNTTGCPLSYYSDIFNAAKRADELGAYFRLPPEPYIKIFALDPDAVRGIEDQEPAEKYDYGRKLFNRKFKFSFSTVHRNPETGIIEPDNCVELRINEVGIAPMVNPRTEKVDAYYVYTGGSMGEKNGKPSFASHAVPFGMFTEDNLMKGLHDIAKVHEEWGDRKNRVWARMKYVIHAKGIDWYRDRVREKGAEFELPDPNFDPGPREMHHGWTTLPTDGKGGPGGKLAYGAYIECGRLVDTEEDEDREQLGGNVTGNGAVKTMVRQTLESFPDVKLMITPNQELLFTEIDPAAKQDFEAKLAELGHGKRKGKVYSKLRVLSGACVGLPTCKLSYTGSEQFEPELIDQLEEMGYGDMNEAIGITGCERQCFRPATKTIAWIGQGPNLYSLKVGGSEDARHIGFWLADKDGRWHMRQVPRNEVAMVTATLFEFYLNNRESEAEDMGAYHRRIGADAIIDYLTENPDTSHLMVKTYASPYPPHLNGHGESKEQI